MSISLDKKTGINLSKGSKISLEKEGKKLEEVCIGMNWGVINKSALFGLIKQKESVDLDGSVTLFDENKQAIDTVYYHKLTSNDGAIKHSGDDRVGDTDGDDDIDNEIIQINLKKVSSNITQIVFYLNSFNGQDFGNIPYAKIRIFEGTKDKVESVFATFNLANDTTFKGKVSMVMGKLIRKGDDWEFMAIGEATKDKAIKGTIETIQEKYL